MSDQGFSPRDDDHADSSPGFVPFDGSEDKFRPFRRPSAARTSPSLATSASSRPNRDRKQPDRYGFADDENSVLPQRRTHSNIHLAHKDATSSTNAKGKERELDLPTPPLKHPERIAFTPGQQALPEEFGMGEDIYVAALLHTKAVTEKKAAVKQPARARCASRSTWCVCRSEEDARAMIGCDDENCAYEW
jgi:hypothetical protein